MFLYVKFVLGPNTALERPISTLCRRESKFRIMVSCPRLDSCPIQLWACKLSKRINRLKHAIITSVEQRPVAEQNHIKWTGACPC